MRKMKKNRKASFYAEALTQFFSYLILILLILIFFFVFTPKGCSNSSDKQGTTTQTLDGLDSNRVLLSYLRTEDTQDAGKNMADLLTSYYLEEDSRIKEELYNRIDTKTKEIFSPLEYCYLNNGGIKVKSGYAVFILERPDEDLSGFIQSNDRKFKSKNFYYDYTKLKINQQIPLNNNKIIYVQLLVSATEQDDKGNNLCK